MRAILIAFVFMSVSVYGQNSNNDKLNEYYKERGYAVPEPNTNMQTPVRKSSKPIITNDEINAYPLNAEPKETKKDSNEIEYKLSAYDRLQISKKSNEAAIAVLKDNRVNTIEYNNVQDVQSVNEPVPTIAESSKSDLGTYILVGVLVTFVGFIGFKIRKG